MKKLYALVTLLLPFFFSNALAQDHLPTEGPGFYFNSFQHYKSRNVDSALYFVKLLAANKNYLPTLEDLLHDTYAQAFMTSLPEHFENQEQKQAFMQLVDSARKLLPAMLADTSPALKKAVQPIYYWTQVQENKNNDNRLKELVAEYMKTQLLTTDMFANRVARYALLIYKEIAPKKSMQATVKQLIAPVMSYLKNNQITNIDGAPRHVLEKRAWHRYLFAYANSVQGNALLAEKKIKEAGPYLKTAFEYSPDIIDKNIQHSFFYDMVFLTDKEEVTFQDEYISYLTKNSGDKQETLSSLLTAALVTPALKDQLKSYYNSNFSDKGSFNDYWLQAINQKAKEAPAISIKLMDGTQFSFATNKNKWTLLDFWGTWCGPCRREHPDLEKFYKSVQTSSRDKITLVTIACMDSEKNVTTYMSENKYTFPVALSDKQAEKSYNINSYPSKILISPQGKYLVIPFNIDWVDFVKKYADL